MPAKPNEIQIIRVYDAPVKLVWDAFTDLKHVEKWWGPRGFTLTTKSKELRPGGKWIYTMHGPDGTDYPNIATYHEVIKYEKLVYDHGGNEERQKLFTVTVLFNEQNGKTKVTLTFALDTPEQAKMTKQFIKQANGNSTWDRFGEYLENETTGKETFIINRSFEANKETVYKMWTTPESFSQWLGPAEAKMTFINAQIKESATSQWKMTTPEGEQHGQLNYKKIDPPSLLIYTQNFCDEKGRLTKPFFSQTYPDQLLTTVKFEEEEPNQTRVTVRWEIEGKATENERKTFQEMKPSMNQGWNESFDKLESLLTKNIASKEEHDA